MNPQPSWEELAPYYSSSYEPYDPSHGATSTDDEVVTRAQETGEFRHVKVAPGARILDVGCGAGYFLRIANRLGAIAEGIEPSEVAAQRAKDVGLSVFQGTLEDFADRFPDRQYDLITSNHVLEHVPEPVRTLSAMRRLLAPRGLIWIGVPNAACSFCQTMKGNWHSADLPYHLMQFTPQSLEHAGRLAGLRLHFLSTFSLATATAASIRLLLRYRYFIPRRLTLQLGVIDTYFAPRLAERMDSKRRGEAILAQFQKND
jgi:2-polyprenyl-3-methyl-5-hydroxy-6-metoxy-1,4-benzoquinol methylase